MAPFALEPEPSFTTAAFVFTDIEGYSTLYTRFGLPFQAVVDRHNVIVRALMAEHNGREVRNAGDGFFCSFPRAYDALIFAIGVQRAVMNERWAVGAEEIDLLVRIGIHVGDAGCLDHPTGAHDYFGEEVNRAARIGGAAAGGQILISEATRMLAARSIEGQAGFTDLGVHRLKGTGEEQLWQVTADGLRVDFPPPASLSSSRHNLPLPLTPFIGRGEEIARCCAMIADPSVRMITIAGISGLGKSRFAQHVAELVYGQFPDGVWWIPLETAFGADAVIDRIARELRMHLQPQPSIREQVWDFHRARSLLLVLDNVEQIEVGELSDVVLGLLEAAQGVKCLLTSTARTRIRLERVLELRSLATGDAMRLFVDRATAVDADFEMSGADESDVAAICETLEGIPLAVELAASLVLLFSPRQIRKRVANQLDLLSDDPSMPRRHVALRAAIAHSVETLSESGKTLCARLSAFAGGFTVDAVEGILGAEAVTGLRELRNHALIHIAAPRSDGGADSERLGMYEAVRQFAAGMLDDPEIARRHASYYADFAESETRRLFGPDSADAVAILSADADNIRAAIERALDFDSKLALRLAVALAPCLQLDGRSEEALKLITEARDRVAASEEARCTDMAAAAIWASNLAHDVGEIDRARVEAEHALEIASAAGRSAEVASALNLLCLLSTEAGNLDEGFRCIRQATDACPESDHGLRAKIYHNHARLADRAGDLDAAVYLYETSLAERRAIGDRVGEAASLVNLGVIDMESGNYESSLRKYLSALAVNRQLRNRFMTAVCLYNIGELLEIDGDDRSALLFYIHAGRLFRETGSPHQHVSAEQMRKMAERVGAEKFGEFEQSAVSLAWEPFVDQKWPQR